MALKVTDLQGVINSANGLSLEPCDEGIDYEAILALTDLVNAMITASRRRGLTRAEVFIIQSLLGETFDYEAMAQSSQGSHTCAGLKRVGGPLWKDLTTAFNLGVTVRKRSFKGILLSNYKDFAERLELGLSPTSMQKNNLRRENFFGRLEERSQLSDFLVKYRVVNLYGSLGIGKTALGKQFLESPDFNLVIYKSFLDTSWVEEMDQLVAQIKENRCLLILDDAIASPLIGAPEKRSSVCQGLILKMLHGQHSSRLLLISRDRFDDIDELGLSHGCRTLQLNSLPIRDAVGILGSIGTEQQRYEIAENYNGNPALLSWAYRCIKEEFQGNVSSYLGLGTVLMPNEPLRLIVRQIQGMNPLERLVLNTISQKTQEKQTRNQEWIIREVSAFGEASISEIVEAITSVCRRGLIDRVCVERGEGVAFELFEITRKAIRGLNKEVDPPSIQVSSKTLAS